MQESIGRHLEQLCTIGNRFIGSAGNAAAASYIEHVFQGASLDTRRLTFACQSWHDLGGTLRVGDQVIHILPNTYSTTCDVTAPLVSVRSLAELSALDDVHGHILVMCGELTRDPLSSYSENAVYLPELDRQVGLLLREKHPLAVITVCAAPAYLRPVIEDMNLSVPSATVSAEDGIQVLTAPGQTARLTIASERGKSETSHIIATNLRPSGRRRIIVCAHYDTNRHTEGAWDNGSGVAAMLALADYAKTYPLPISTEFIAFTAEEYEVEGLDTDPYLVQYGLSVPKYEYGKEIIASYRPSDLDNVLAVINFDGVGQTLMANTVSALSCSDELKQILAEVKQPYTGLIKVEGWPASNHYAFYSNGIPSIPLSSMEMKNVLHHPRDVREWLSVSQIEEASRFALDLIVRLADKSPEWCRMQRP